MSRLVGNLGTIIICTNFGKPECLLGLYMKKYYMMPKFQFDAQLAIWHA